MILQLRNLTRRSVYGYCSHSTITSNNYHVSELLHQEFFEPQKILLSHIAIFISNAPGNASEPLSGSIAPGSKKQTDIISHYVPDERNKLSRKVFIILVSFPHEREIRSLLWHPINVNASPVRLYQLLNS